MNRLSRVLASCACMAATGASHAAPTIQSTFFFTDTYGANSSILLGNYLQLSTVVVSPDSVAEVSAVATQGALTRNMNFFTGPIFAEKNFNRFLTDTSLTGAWDLVVSDSSGSTSGSFAAIANPELLPLLLQLQVLANGLTPTLTWDLPDLTGFDVDTVVVRAVNVSTGSQVFQSARFAASQTNFVIPAGALLAGVNYEFRVLLEDFEGRRLENRSNTFSSVYTAPIPEPGTWGLMLAGLLAMAGAHRWTRRS